MKDFVIIQGLFSYIDNKEDNAHSEVYLLEISFSELRTKIVVSITDGKRLGNVIDIIFEECTAKIIGIIVPNSKGVLSIFHQKEDLFIPYNNICKIGQDTILVDLTITNTTAKTVTKQTSNYIETNYKQL